MPPVKTAHLVSYVQLIQHRAQQRFPEVEFTYAIGERFAVVSTKLDGGIEPRSYVVLETGLTYSIPSHESPDPELIGSVHDELEIAQANGELEIIRAKLAKGLEIESDLN